MNGDPVTPNVKCDPSKFITGWDSGWKFETKMFFRFWKRREVLEQTVVQARRDLWFNPPSPTWNVPPLHWCATPRDIPPPTDVTTPPPWYASPLLAAVFGDGCSKYIPWLFGGPNLLLTLSTVIDNGHFRCGGGVSFQLPFQTVNRSTILCETVSFAGNIAWAQGRPLTLAMHLNWVNKFAIIKMYSRSAVPSLCCLWKKKARSRIEADPGFVTRPLVNPPPLAGHWSTKNKDESQPPQRHAIPPHWHATSHLCAMCARTNTYNIIQKQRNNINLWSPLAFLSVSHWQSAAKIRLLFWVFHLVNLDAELFW